MLGPWLESAKDLATTPAEEANYEYNARNILDIMFYNWFGTIRLSSEDSIGQYV